MAVVLLARPQGLFGVKHAAAAVGPRGAAGTHAAPVAPRARWSLVVLACS